MQNFRTVFEFYKASTITHILHFYVIILNSGFGMFLNFKKLIFPAHPFYYLMFLKKVLEYVFEFYKAFKYYLHPLVLN